MYVKWMKVSLYIVFGYWVWIVIHLFVLRYKQDSDIELNLFN